MGNSRTFQFVLIGIFLALGVAGILFFAFFQGFGSEANPYGNKVVIWGTIDDEAFVSVMTTLAQKDQNFSVVSYEEKDERTFARDLVDALAEGTGPDVVILPHDLLVSQRGKILPIPYEQYPIRTFKDTYIDGAEIFLLSEGIYAIPLAVDPLLLYWNRSTFATKGLAYPPRTWEELVAVTVPTVVERSFSSDIMRAALAFGEYTNIRNAKEILAMLFLQAGSTMVYDDGNRLTAELNRGASQGIAPGQAALQFYTEFSNPAKSVYTWNRAEPQDRQAFLAGDLAMYVGFGSEYPEIEAGNPNLDFDVAELPQSADARQKKGYGTFYGGALMKNSQNLQGAQMALYALAGQAETEAYAAWLKWGPVYRASFGTIPQDPVRAVIARAALVARGWLDPEPMQSETIFRQMVEDVTSGRSEASNAVGDAEARLQQIIEN